jgi:hypothetical protein
LVEPPPLTLLLSLLSVTSETHESVEEYNIPVEEWGLGRGRRGEELRRGVRESEEKEREE